MIRFAVFLLSVALLLAGLGALMMTDDAFGRKPPQPERKKPSETDVPFATVDSGTSSAITERMTVVIKDEGEWLALWKRHTANQFPAPPVPNVRFPAEMVIAVFSGQRSSGGYAVRIDRIKDTGSKLVVIVSEASPGPGAITISALTQPYHIVKLAKSELPVDFQGM